MTHFRTSLLITSVNIKHTFTEIGHVLIKINVNKDTATFQVTSRQSRDVACHLVLVVTV